MKVSFLVLLILFFQFTPTRAQRETAIVEGIVLNSTTQSPLADITVTIATAANRTDIIAPTTADAFLRLTTVTGQDGAYRFLDLPPGDYVIFAAGESITPLFPFTLDLTAGKTERVDLPMTVGGSIIGKITEADGSPANTGTVMLVDRKLIVQTASIRGDGSYLFEYVYPSDDYLVFVQTDNSAGISIPNQVVEESTALELDVETELASRMSGQVISDTGEPIQNALVALESETMRLSGLTDENGFYTVGEENRQRSQNLLPTTYAVTVIAPGHLGIYESAVDLGIPTNYRQDFTLQRSGTVMGQVLDAAGNPIDGATISGVNASGIANHALSQPDGFYQLDLPVSDQPYSLEVGFTGYVPAQVENITLTAGQVQDNINFTLQPGIFFAGRLIRADGGFIRSAVVDFYDTDERVLSSTTEDSGLFIFEGLATGDYVVIASSAAQDAGYVGTVSITEDVFKPVEIPFEATGTLTGVSLNAGVIVVSFQGIPISVTSAAEDGNYIIEGLAPADYVVTAYNQLGMSAPNSITIAAGQEAILNLQIR